MDLVSLRSFLQAWKWNNTEGHRDQPLFTLVLAFVLKEQMTFFVFRGQPELVNQPNKIYVLFSITCLIYLMCPHALIAKRHAHPHNVQSTLKSLIIRYCWEQGCHPHVIGHLTRVGRIQLIMHTYRKVCHVQQTL